MTAQRLVENCVLTNQTAVVDEMLNKHLLPEEYIYPFLGDVMEWWLIDSWLAERLKREGEVIIEEYGCYWWGRQSSGQAIYMDSVIQEIAAGKRAEHSIYAVGRLADYRLLVILTAITKPSKQILSRHILDNCGLE